jgi:cysteine desulfurase/selenocysteine lyase
VSDTTHTPIQSARWVPPPYLYEAGLQNYAGMIGAGAAAEYVMKIGLDNIHEHEVSLNRYVTDKLLNIDGIILIGPHDPAMRGGIISFIIEGITPRCVALAMNDRKNIMLRAGDHCTHGWFNARGIGVLGSTRASMYLYNTKEEMDLLVGEIDNYAKDPDTIEEKYCFIS